ncbi:MAG: hypothetical protein IPP98_02510 [Gemmatimonadetes bacterium]|nr:hypothetical protein [Gemmatimonadota bacterium]
MDDLQSRRDLAEALGNVVAETAAAESAAREKRLSPRSARRRKLLPFLAIAWIGLAWAWIARPAVIFGPEQPRRQTATERDALARNALYLQRARVEQFRADSGRLPEVLGEAGEVEEGVTYIRTPPDFVLVTRAGEAQSLQLTSRMNADSFLGDALGRLPRAGGQ